jgi:hypothetical protein
MWFVRAALAPIHGAAAALLRADVLHPSRLNNIIVSCEDSQEDGASMMSTHMTPKMARRGRNSEAFSDYSSNLLNKPVVSLVLRQRNTVREHRGASSSSASLGQCAGNAREVTEYTFRKHNSKTGEKNATLTWPGAWQCPALSGWAGERP